MIEVIRTASKLEFQGMHEDSVPHRHHPETVGKWFLIGKWFSELQRQKRDIQLKASFIVHEYNSECPQCIMPKISLDRKADWMRNIQRFVPQNLLERWLRSLVRCCCSLVHARLLPGTTCSVNCSIFRHPYFTLLLNHLLHQIASCHSPAIHHHSIPSHTRLLPRDHTGQRQKNHYSQIIKPVKMLGFIRHKTNWLTMRAMVSRTREM